MTERIYQRGNIVYREGDKGDCFYRILNGSVEVTVDAGQPSEKKLTTLGQGDFFGEMAVMAGRERSGTITVLEDNTKLLELMADTKSLTSRQVIEKLMDAVEEHRAGADPNDDLTLMCLSIHNS